LLDALEHEGRLRSPVAAVGESYGASLALRWKGADARVGSVVAIAPYAQLSNAVLNICHEYAHWMPQWVLKSGLKRLTSVLKVAPGELDTGTLLVRNPVAALFVAGIHDKVTPTADVQRLYEVAARGSEMIVVPNATHEALPYYFDELVPPALSWLDGSAQNQNTGWEVVSQP
jgi:pimeloyl-ACP methyl ester carboxylesterase